MDTLVTVTLSQAVCTCIYYIAADLLRLNTLDTKGLRTQNIVYMFYIIGIVECLV